MSNQMAVIKRLFIEVGVGVRSSKKSGVLKKLGTPQPGIKLSFVSFFLKKTKVLDAFPSLSSSQEDFKAP